jgi:SAM-dependent methyltransferase
MLAIAQRRLGARSAQVQLRQMDAEAMSALPDASVDAYSMSLVMKICDRRRALAEAFRILRLGGRLVILEASNIRWRPLHRAYLAYMSTCMPVLGWLATGGDASAYRYLLHGIREFPSPRRLPTRSRRTDSRTWRSNACPWASSPSIRRESQCRLPSSGREAVARTRIGTRSGRCRNGAATRRAHGRCHDDRRHAFTTARGTLRCLDPPCGR